MPTLVVGAVGSTADYVEVCLYALRLAGTLLLFLLGLRAPGIAWVEDYIPYQRHASGGTNNVSLSTESVSLVPCRDNCLTLGKYCLGTVRQC